MREEASGGSPEEPTAGTRSPGLSGRPRRQRRPRGPVRVRVSHELTSAHRLQVNAWTGVAAVVGLLLGVRLALAGHPAAVALPACGLGLPLFMRGMLRMILGAAAWPIITLYNPSGRSTPSRPGYSHAESLAVRGRHEEAIAAYREAARAHPDDRTWRA